MPTAKSKPEIHVAFRTFSVEERTFSPAQRPSGGFCFRGLRRKELCLGGGLTGRTVLPPFTCADPSVMRLAGGFFLLPELSTFSRIIQPGCPLVGYLSSSARAPHAIRTEVNVEAKM